MKDTDNAGDSLLTFVSVIKLLSEIALLALVGQGVLGLLVGARREQNLFYQLLQIMTRPFVSTARLITPRAVIDRHVPIVAFLLLSFVWIAATFTKISICVRIGVELCK
ncbi:hypothetical protein [Ramlibacter sp. WS9]|uniref:hypothetical protein n=1 Tax=Ramlibacter sp. WS9 TaxID=1882741 RepID=UPI001143C65D|nr:hypothetical protein [Ramlibacter sp. WS9]ROZ66570.1 hypothetical protein EEB15_26345 [Ramlibacter sp. WS9]